MKNKLHNPAKLGLLKKVSSILSSSVRGAGNIGLGKAGEKRKGKASEGQARPVKERKG